MLNAEHDHTTNIHFPVVGIASAALEIDILKKIISEISPDSGMAFIIIEDLNLSQTEDLTEILSGCSAVPVHEIINTVKMRPNNVYVVPRHNFLIFENEILKLQPYLRSSKPSQSVDLFFEVLAEFYRSYAVGMVLSWQQSYGTVGLKKLKERGGSSISVRNTNSISKHDKNADIFDYFITPENAVQQLIEINKSYQINHAYQEEEISQFDETIFKEILQVIFLKTQTDFHRYKHQTLRRRIAKRMVETKQESAENYLSLLKNSHREQDSLFNDFLISVTYFFRDPLFFESLQQNVFPSLLENRHGQELRIWSAGCATGEEIYSLAICLDEYLHLTNNADITVHFFASDLSEKCIEKARAGLYSAQDLQHISENRRSRYFTKKDSDYCIHKSIRDKCIFAVHDLSRDFPFSKIDLILCRNVMIYFDTELQRKVLTGLHYALKENGFLFLGKTETARSAPDLFTPVALQEKIFTKNDVPARLTRSVLPKRTETLNASALSDNVLAGRDLKKITSDYLVENYAPATVLITPDMEIVQFQGNTSPFLQPHAERPSYKVTDMLYPELREAVQNAVEKAKRKKKTVQGSVTISQNPSMLVSFEAAYLHEEDLLLIIFIRKPIQYADDGNDAISHTGSLPHPELAKLNNTQQQYIEELRAANKELLKRSEDLQFLNEQLEITAEELVSKNVELSCTNDELRNRRDELHSMRNYFESIVNTIKEPLLIVDQKLIMHSANPAFYRYFETRREHVEGVSLLELLHAPGINELVLQKIQRGQSVENIKIKFELSAGTTRIMLLNTATISESAPEGMILIAMEDITDLEQKSETLKIKNAELENHTKQLETFTIAASGILLEPIRKIYMFGKKIIDSDALLPDSVRHNAARLLNTAVNMNQLIEDLINFSKINFTEKKFKKTDLNIVLKKAVNNLKSIISEHKAVVTADFLPNVNIIPWQMQLLFTHLISNAVKSAKEDLQPEIKIQMQYIEHADIEDQAAAATEQYMQLTISDNGRGFSKKYENLIFDPFYKLESNDKQYGTGLGLTLVQKIVWNHKGFIKASSSPGKGTSIIILLPHDKSLIENYSQN